MNGFSNTKLGKGLGPGMIYTLVADGIDKALAGRPSLTLGMLVALAVHDYDNKRGLSVLTSGKPAVVYGDSHLGRGRYGEDCDLQQCEPV